MNILKRIYHKIPLKLRYQFTTFLWSFSNRLKKSFDPLFPPVYIYTGVEKTSGASLTFAFAGAPSQTQEYWAQKVLGPEFQKHCLGRSFFIFIIPSLKNSAPACSFLLADVNPLSLLYFSRKPGFNIPRWINMDIDISLPMEKLLGSERSEILRKIKKNQLSFELTRTEEHLDDFYHGMYLPYIKTRYKDIAMLNVRQMLLEILNNGDLILIKKDGAVIAGGLVEYGENEGRFRMLGIRDGNSQYVHLGAIGALYYFAILEMKKKGYPVMKIGGSRPLLSDGVTKFKKSLKARVLPRDPNARIRLRLLKDSPGLQSFLIHNPFVFYKNDEKPYRAVFMEAKEACTARELENDLRVSACNGSEGTDLYLFHGTEKTANYPELARALNVTAQKADELFSR